MGLIFSRENARIEEHDPTSNNAYRYPPKTGSYFASHFIMGGERFETTLPESYLFGENMDLNFLGSKPTPHNYSDDKGRSIMVNHLLEIDEFKFPYPAPQPQEPTRTLHSLINIRKESLRFVKSPELLEKERSSENSPFSTAYNIEFTFDADVRCKIQINYFCTEEVTANGILYTPRDLSISSECYHYKKGVNQQFSQVSHIFDPSKYAEDMLNYKPDSEVIPVLIHCVAEEGEEPRQQHSLMAVVEKNSDGTYTLKPLKSKIFVDGLCYLLQEIYGIENKNVEVKDGTDDDVEYSGECVICMSDGRDTLILPCRHLCCCSACGDSLRFQANNCPICRAPFRALLQIRAVRKSNNTLSQVGQNVENQREPSHDIPPGYEAVSLIEALNGPMQPPAPLVPSFAPQIPPFSNSPDVRHKRHHLERRHSGTSSLRHIESSNLGKGDPLSNRGHGNLEESSVPEVVVASMLSSGKAVLKSESLSLTRGEGRKHRKGFRTSSAPEKMRLLANSAPIVNEVGHSRRKLDKDAELAETKSLLESNVAAEEVSGTASSSPKTSRPCSRNSRISLSTPHSLHLCEKSSKDTSPGGDDSDYFTPEDPSTTILVDQGTDTSLDTPQSTEASDSAHKSQHEYPLVGKHKAIRERHLVDELSAPDTDVNIHDRRKRNSDPSKKAESSHPKSPNCHSLVVSLENPSSLPSTPASNASNHSSGDSFSSSSSTRLLLRPQSYDILPE